MENEENIQTENNISVDNVITPIEDNAGQNTTTETLAQPSSTNTDTNTITNTQLNELLSKVDNIALKQQELFKQIIDNKQTNNVGGDNDVVKY